MDYIINTKIDQEKMLAKIGISDLDGLFCDIPDKIKLRHKLDISEGLDEMGLYNKFSMLSKKNKTYISVFRGAGAYDHYIPAAVTNLVSRSEFLTAYTPYQAELSQGILQAIFEYQSMICRLTDMDVSNASVYDGASAAAEAVKMFADLPKKKNTVLVSETIKPNTMQVIKTYCYALGINVVIIPGKNGLTDIEKLHSLTNENAFAMYSEQINKEGLIEDITLISSAAHKNNLKYIVGTYPIASAILTSPGEAGADASVGEGQPLGMSLNFGGPYLGYMAAKNEHMRKLPGRIVGQTKDGEGRRAFVLTLQAREQHIRREKASSSICSNEALCALTANIYLSYMGRDGLVEIAERCADNAAYFADCLTGAGLKLKYNGNFFNEFLTVSEDISSSEILSILEKNDILGGLKISESEILWCATEKNTIEAMQKATSIIKNLINSYKR